MREVLTRRLTHESDSSFDIKPDLIMMDGGKGQVNIALEVLNDLNISIPVCGMVKMITTERELYGIMEKKWKLIPEVKLSN